MVNWVKVIMNAQNNATNLVTKATGCGCQQGAWFLTWVRDNNVHTCMHTGSETHPATYPVVCREVFAVHKTPRLRMCGVQWRQQHSLIHSLMVCFDIKHKERFLSWWEHFFTGHCDPWSSDHYSVWQRRAPLNKRQGGTSQKNSGLTPRWLAHTRSFNTSQRILMLGTTLQ